VSVSLSFDRLEGGHKQVAVLLTDGGETITVPRSLLPTGAQPGDVLTLELERDAEASRRLSETTRQIHRRLSERDPGGDIRL
jgi:Protein of unknown function (DUF3006)